MTDPSKYADPIQLGPLTANEWGTLFLPGDDERNLPFRPALASDRVVADGGVDL